MWNRKEVNKEDLFFCRKLSTIQIQSLKEAE